MKETARNGKKIEIERKKEKKKERKKERKEERKKERQTSHDHDQIWSSDSGKSSLKPVRAEPASHDTNDDAGWGHTARR